MMHWARAAIIAATALASVASAGPVSDWAELQTAFEKADSNPMQNFDAERYQAYSKAMLAMFEAANAVDRRYVSYVGLPAAAPGASGEAAVIAAAHDALTAFYPDHKGEIEKAYAMGLAGVAAGPGRDAGVHFRTTNDASLPIGHNIGNLGIARLAPLPK